MAGDLQVEYAFINASASGNTTVVAAQSGQRIIILQGCVITGGTNNVKFQSNGTTDICATAPLATNGGFVLPFSQVGWAQTNIGESLTFYQSAGVQTAVYIVWCPRST